MWLSLIQKETIRSKTLHFSELNDWQVTLKLTRDMVTASRETIAEVQNSRNFFMSRTHTLQILIKISSNRLNYVILKSENMLET